VGGREFLPVARGGGTVSNRASSFASHSCHPASASRPGLAAKAPPTPSPASSPLKPPQLPQDLLPPMVLNPETVRYPHARKPRPQDPHPHFMGPAPIDGGPVKTHNPAPASRPATPSHRRAPPPSPEGPPPTPDGPAPPAPHRPGTGPNPRPPEPTPPPSHMGGPVLQGSPTRLQRHFHRLPHGLLRLPPRTTARYQLIPGKGRRRTPSPPHLGFQSGDPLPRLLPLRPEPFQFGQKLLAIRTGGLGGHSPSMIPCPETLNKYDGGLALSGPSWGRIGGISCTGRRLRRVCRPVGANRSSLPRVLGILRPRLGEAGRAIPVCRSSSWGSRGGPSSGRLGLPPVPIHGRA